MKLNLTRPLIFFDLETTGTNCETDRIVQISFIKVHPDGTEDSPRTGLINPECHIPEECTAIHHITDEMVADKPTFKSIAKALAREFTGCDIAGFNSNKFDVPMLIAEFNRAGVDFDYSNVRFIDVQNIYHKLEPRNLRAAYRQYCGGKDFDNAHSADADTKATLEVLKAQLDRYPDVLENNVDFLAKFSTFGRNVDLAGRLIYDDNNNVIVNFGKYRGRPLTEIFATDTSYYDWVQKGSFSDDTKRWFQRLYVAYKQSKK